MQKWILLDPQMIPQTNPQTQNEFIKLCESASLETIELFHEQHKDLYLPIDEGIIAAINAGRVDVLKYIIEKCIDKHPFWEEFLYDLMAQVFMNTTFPKNAYCIAKYLLKNFDYDIRTLSQNLYKSQNLSIIYLLMKMGAKNDHVPINIGQLLLNRHLIRCKRKSTTVSYKRKLECTALHNVLQVLGSYNDVTKFCMRFVGFNIWMLQSKKRLLSKKFGKSLRHVLVE